MAMSPTRLSDLTDIVVLTAQDLTDLQTWSEVSNPCLVVRQPTSLADQLVSIAVDVAEEALKALYEAAAFPGTTKYRFSTGLSASVIEALGSLEAEGWVRRHGVDRWQFTETAAKSVDLVQHLSRPVQLAKAQ